MDLRDYQHQALKTDQMAGREDTLIVPLLGLAGEAGTLISEYKKFLRDGEAHRLHKDRVGEELGDLLWYLANVASKYGLDLGDIADANLVKVSGRWAARSRDPGGAPRFDTAYPENERLPRRFEVEVTETCEAGALTVRMFVDGTQCGDGLTDNAYAEDGYRFHDAFHLAYVAVLGWSPIIRTLLHCKRKSDPRVDEVEDGGRAIILDEAVAAIAFDYAKVHAYLEGVSVLDEWIIKAMMHITSHLEVAQCSAGEWEIAVFRGFRLWRELMDHRQGRIIVNMDERSLTFFPA